MLEKTHLWICSISSLQEVEVRLHVSRSCSQQGSRLNTRKRVMRFTKKSRRLLQILGWWPTTTLPSKDHYNCVLIILWILRESTRVVLDVYPILQKQNLGIKDASCFQKLTFQARWRWLPSSTHSSRIVSCGSLAKKLHHWRRGSTWVTVILVWM